MGNRLAGRVAIVTGAATGLGHAFALGFAAEGANIVAVDVADASATCEAAKKLGVKALAVKADVSSEEQTLKMAEEAIRAFGKIDVLVNNAGIFKMVPFDQLPLADWKRTLAVNVDGAFLCSRAVLPHMREKGYGRIINISSGTVWMGAPTLTHYVASKSALIGMTRCMAVEFAEQGITVNCIAPGFIHTDGADSMAPPEVREMMWTMVLGMQPIKRKETPQDLLGAAVFFASDDSSFCTGQTLCIDGGVVKH